MLSSQTKDEETDAAVDKLCAAFGGTLSLEALLAIVEVYYRGLNRQGRLLAPDDTVSLLQPLLPTISFLYEEINLGT